jgi:hypothetical protein
MGFNCPVFNLPGETTADDLDEFDKYRSTSRLYFNASYTLDYFNFFLDRGEHTATAAGAIVEFEFGNCIWKVEGRQYHWPMVRTDCVLGYDAIEKRAAAQGLGTSLNDLKGAIRSYHANGSKSTKAQALLYALNILSGDGTSPNAGPSITGCGFPTGGPELGIKFGAYYGP